MGRARVRVYARRAHAGLRRIIPTLIGAVMRVLRRTLSFLVGACALALAGRVDAAPYGDTVVGNSTTLAPCTEQQTLASIPLQVDIPSRILATINGSAVSIDNTVAYGYGAIAQLYDATGRTLIATSQWSNIVVGLYLQATNVSQVLFDPTTNLAATLPPGNYVLFLNIQTSGSCGGAGLYIQSPTLTYVLLSSTVDRIFGDGFALSSREPDVVGVV
jgi:hypothetical protein